ncbi:MAG: SpoIVB peptidase [Oscillospiraceae bacterium]|jgi:stage IV sporulation protein B|nr:SpoIVB peptidase [Oscillospiraceae bacterium]
MDTKKIKITALLISAVIALAGTSSPASAAGAESGGAIFLVPVGRAVGIRLESDGVVVVGIPDVCSDGATPSPAKNSGLKAGDIITRVGKSPISSGDELKAAMKRQDGAPVSVEAQRGGGRIQCMVTPRKTKSGEYSLGLWVRDGITGIGTVTFYDPATNIYGALGHAVNDSDTGVVLPVRDGAISRVSVSDVAKGKAGSPGQLHGSFDFGGKLGTVTANTASGIFGKITAPELSRAPENAIEAARGGDIHTGAAYIMSNVRGGEVKKYTAEISRVYSGGEADGRSMLVTVTDPELTEITGGIVQGMSGSPIIQDGKLIGAVTHVLISDPLKGYGISIEKMLSGAGIYTLPALAA